MTGSPNFKIIATVAVLSIAGVALSEFFSSDLPHTQWDVPARPDKFGRGMCEKGWLHYRGWCRFDVRAYAHNFDFKKQFQYPMSEYVPPVAVTARSPCVTGYLYDGHDEMCLPLPYVINRELWQYPMSEYEPPGTVSAAWGPEGAMCPDKSFIFVAREMACLPRSAVRFVDAPSGW